MHFLVLLCLLKFKYVCMYNKRRPFGLEEYHRPSKLYITSLLFLTLVSNWIICVPLCQLIPEEWLFYCQRLSDQWLDFALEDYLHSTYEEDKPCSIYKLNFQNSKTKNKIVTKPRPKLRLTAGNYTNVQAKESRNEKCNPCS